MRHLNLKDLKNKEEILTAFALGELESEERERIELLLKEDLEQGGKLNAEIEAIREMASLLENVLEKEPIQYQSEEEEKLEVSELPCRIEELGKVSKEIAREPRVRSRRRVFWSFASAAVCAGIVVLLCLPIVYRESALLESPGMIQDVLTDGAAYSLKEEVPLALEAAPAPQTAPVPQALPAEAARSRGAVKEKAKAAPEEMLAAKVAPAAEFAELQEEVYESAEEEFFERGPIVHGLKKLENGAKHFFKLDGAISNAPVLRKEKEAARRSVRAPLTEPAEETPSVPDWQPLPPPRSEMAEQAFQNPAEQPFSTFGADVDTASYTHTRELVVKYGQRPNPDAVRTEEFINYFKYDLQGPADDSDCPFQPKVEIQKHPWQPELFMASISLKGREIPEEKRPRLNLVFLIDVSGSMCAWNKLPLVKDGMLELLDNLKPEDTVSIVTYASDTQVLLEPTSGKEKEKIEKEILSLSASGSTMGSRGLQRAYEQAKKNFSPEAENRILLCSDGDFNVGITDEKQLADLVQREAKSGIFLTVLGFGMGNYQDYRMKMLASHGNGVYAYVNSREEAKRILGKDLLGTMVTIAKDVKFQVEFNPAHVAAYRLIGYEMRKLAAQDFHDDRKDAGEIGVGHCVTALYEIVPAGGKVPEGPQVDKPRYAQQTESEGAKAAESAEKPHAKDSPEWFFVKLRWKAPQAKTSSLKTFPVEFKPETLAENPPSANFRLASGAALFALLLRESAYTNSADMKTVLELIQPALNDSDEHQEFKEFVEKAIELRF